MTKIAAPDNWWEELKAKDTEPHKVGILEWPYGPKDPEEVIGFENARDAADQLSYSDRVVGIWDSKEKLVGVLVGDQFFVPD